MLDEHAEIERLYHEACQKMQAHPEYGRVAQAFEKAHADFVEKATARKGRADGGSVSGDDPNPPPPDRQLSPLGLYSHAAEAADALPQDKGSPQQMMAMLQKAGARPAELQNAGLPEAFAGRPSITKQELAAHLRKSIPPVEEKVLGGGQASPRDVQRLASWAQSANPNLTATSMYNKAIQGNRAALMELAEEGAPRELLLPFLTKNSPTKYHGYTLPDGQNYREVLLKLNKGGLDAKGFGPAERAEYSMLAGIPEGQRTLDQRLRFMHLDGQLSSIREAAKASDYKSSHWDDPNVLAHIRMSDRVGYRPAFAVVHKISGNQSQPFDTLEQANKYRDNLPDTVREQTMVRATARPEKQLHVEELQSDWGQEGREKGFRGDHKYSVEPDLRPHLQVPGMPPPWAVLRDGKPVDTYRNRDHAENAMADYARGKDGLVPSAPYVTSTPGWTDLALKRVLREAALGGHDRIVFTPGQAQADRYDLSKQVASLHYTPEERFGEHVVPGLLTAVDHYNDPVIRERDVPPEKIADYVGKEMADRLLQQKKTNFAGRMTHTLSGVDLKIGGEGMKSYYDKIVPTQLKSLVKKLDPEARIGLHDTKLPGTKPWDHEADEPGPQRVYQGHSLEVTPRLRSAVLRGLPAFSTGGEVDEAAGSIHPDPSDAQKEVGNYRKGHLRLHGLEIALENAKGSERNGVGRDGKPWSVTMPAAYGYIKGTVGADKDHVDTYVGDNLHSKRAFVVDQRDADTGKFDEHKAFLGFGAPKEVADTYVKAFSDGKGHKRLGKMTELHIDDFKHWLKTGNTRKQLAPQAESHGGSVVDRALMLTSR